MSCYQQHVSLVHTTAEPINKKIQSTHDEYDDNKRYNKREPVWPLRAAALVEAGDRRVQIYGVGRWRIM